MQEYSIVLVIFASVVFYQLRTAETNTLLAIIIMSLLAAAAYFYYPKVAPAADKPHNEFAKDVEGRKETVTTSFAISKFPKDLKFIQYNESLREIAKDLRFIKMFDKARLGDLLVVMDKYQKIYMYILAGRYRPESYVPTFVDLRASILEILYSLIHIVPETLKHTYGFQPYDVIQRNIDAFTALSRRMLHVLQSYSKANGYTIPDAYYHPFETAREHLLP